MTNPDEEPAPPLTEPDEPEDGPECEKCGRTGVGVRLYEDVGEDGYATYTLCDECSYECEGCSERRPKKSATETVDGLRCETCANENYVTCANCNDMVPSEDTVEVAGSRGRTSTYCDHCARNSASQCWRCDGWFDPDIVTHVEDRDADLCEDCTERLGVFHCEVCGSHYTEDAYGGESGGTVMCQSCYEEAERDEEEPGPIEGYHDHTRVWNRFGRASRGVYYGVELEAVCDPDHTDYQSVAEYIEETYGTMTDTPGVVNPKEFLFTEDDSSLRAERHNPHSPRRGYETVFHPMAPEWIFDSKNKATLAEILRDMVARHMVSYEANAQNISAGMHVTFSWSVLRPWEKQKFLSLIFKNKGLTTLVSRRKQEDIDQYARVTPPAEPISRMVMKKAGYDAKMVAVNLKKPDNESDEELAEVRIFRGTLKFESFMMNLEYVIACVELARDVKYGLNDMTQDALLDYIWMNEKTYPNIFAWLREKKLLAQRTKPIPEKFKKPFTSGV